MPKRKEPALIVYVGGPLDGQRRNRTGTGSWPTYRTEQGESLPADRGDQLARFGTHGLYRIEAADGPEAARRRIGRDAGRVYIHLPPATTTPQPRTRKGKGKS